MVSYQNNLIATLADDASPADCRRAYLLGINRHPSVEPRVCFSALVRGRHAGGRRRDSHSESEALNLRPDSRHVHARPLQRGRMMMF